MMLSHWCLHVVKNMEDNNVLDFEVIPKLVFFVALCFCTSQLRVVGSFALKNWLFQQNKNIRFGFETFVVCSKNTLLP